MPARHKMPVERQSITHKFSLGGHEGYITAGMYEDGSVGEIFLTDIGKEGSTIKGLMNAFATAISIGLQYGVPLETFVNKFAYIRFEPEGITTQPGDPVREVAARLHHALARLAVPRRRLPRGARHPDPGGQGPQGGAAVAVRERGPGAVRRRHGSDSQSAEPKAANGNGGDGAPAKAPTSALTDTPPVRPARMAGLELGPACEQCGGMMQRTGSCYTCSLVRQQHRLRLIR